MMCTTVLHGGVCHRTSTPHKSGNKMKEKEKKKKTILYYSIKLRQRCQLHQHYCMCRLPATQVSNSRFVT